MISAWQNQTDRFLGFISLSVPWCEQREWSSRCAQIILQHRGPPPSILLCRSFGVWWWWGSVSQSSMLLEMDGSHTHTHTNTPLHAPTSTPRRPISCRPAVKLCIYIMHEAESPERQQQSRVRSGCLLHRVCVCVLGPAWGSRHEPLWGKPSSSSLPPLCSLYETIKMRSINIDDCNFVFVCQNVQLSKFKFKFNNYWNTTEE